MTLLSDLLRTVNDFRGSQGVQGTTGSTQGVQGTQGLQGTVGTAGTTLLTNTQSGTYTLQASDVGKVVSGITTVGIPSDVFNPGENIIILNNESNSSVNIDIAGASPVVSIYESGVVGVLTETKIVKKKSFASVFCTRANEFILSNIFDDALEATGGTEIDSGGYRIHVFTSTGPFNVTNAPPTSVVEYIVVAGGGGGGPTSGDGGGGAGGFRTGTGFPVTVQDYTITVGGGGGASTNGSDSVFDTITSTGGGAGTSSGGNPGGSGGGGGRALATSAGTGNTPPVSPPQGNPGGTGSGPVFSGDGGGGGGAGAAGTPASPSGGPGGIGSPVSWVPASYGTPGPSPGQWFAGGGGGQPAGSGGAGGGGNVNTSGTTNTGGGGGGNSSGGSGIVIIRYPI